MKKSLLYLLSATSLAMVSCHTTDVAQLLAESPQRSEQTLTEGWVFRQAADPTDTLAAQSARSVPDWLSATVPTSWHMG